jgi:hypothetical protein
LPHAFGPSITTAPAAPRRASSSPSTILERYTIVADRADAVDALSGGVVELGEFTPG